jgi:uracil-DNA glycosylase family 4
VNDDSDPVALAREFLVLQKELGVEVVPLPSEDGLVAEALPVSEAPVDLPDEVRTDSLETFASVVLACEACGLCQARNHVVFGSGNPDADVMFIGEAPGREEDLQGVPFVGAAGELLTKMISGIKLDRDDVYIANVIKCRPSGNRDPQPEEIASCEPHLLKQIDLIQPKVICTLGRFAAQTLLKSTTSMGRLRGKVYTYNGIKLIPTYHPAALLRNPQWKRPTWEDLKLLRYEYDGLEL